jgi:hypothetical protein
MPFRHRDSVLLAAAALLVATCGGQPGSERAAEGTAGVRSPAELVEPAHPDEPRTSLWRLTSGDDPRKIAYLLGSIHVARADFYPLDPAIEEAFDASDALVLELDPAAIDAQKTKLATAQRALLPAGETLKDRVSATTWDALLAWLAARRLPLGSVSNFEPWFAALAMNDVNSRELGFDAALGIDRHFSERAGNAKPVEQLETVALQLDVFDGLSGELQEWVLVDALDDLGPEERARMERMVEAWKTGDAATLHALIREPFAADQRTAPIYDALFTRRNAAMADGVDALLEKWNRLFVVVGAGHLVGDDGVVALLERRGYSAEQVPARGR